jgi:hypothetical protein
MITAITLLLMPVFVALSQRTPRSFNNFDLLLIIDILVCMTSIAVEHFAK